LVAWHFSIPLLSSVPRPQFLMQSLFISLLFFLLFFSPQEVGAGRIPPSFPPPLYILVIPSNFSQILWYSPLGSSPNSAIGLLFTLLRVTNPHLSQDKTPVEEPPHRTPVLLLAFGRRLQGLRFPPPPPPLFDPF